MSEEMENRAQENGQITYANEVISTIVTVATLEVEGISGITGGAETDEAVKLADESDGAYAYIHYSRAGYGKLGFRNVVLYE